MVDNPFPPPASEHRPLLDYLIVIAIVVVAITGVGISLTHMESKVSAPIAVGSYTPGSGGALCGGDQLQTVLAYEAIRKNDEAGVLGLASRGVVDYLVAGTTVDASYAEGGMSKVSVKSGSSLGKDCWMPTKLLLH